MKKWYCLRIVVLILSLNSFAQKSTKDYVRLSGKITDKNSDSLLILKTGVFAKDARFKKISVKKDGTFSDTLRVKEDFYAISDGKESGLIYLKNGYNLKITFDTKQWDETMTFKGEGAIPNNYLFKKALYTEKATEDKTIFQLEKDKFLARIDQIVAGYQKLLSETRGLEMSFIQYQNKSFDYFKKNCITRYDKTTGLKKHQEEVLPKGKTSPKFVNYENFDGSKTSLDDFKGKFVYIDLWATWCAPCKKEIPFLKACEKEFHDKNIVFVSISTDRLKDRDKWKKMVTDLQLTGVQLYANGDTSFQAAYEADTIPRFILIDPQGNIVDPNAPRPSEDRLKVLLKEAGVH